MSDHILKQLIQAADRAITVEDFDGLMDFYAEDATLVVKPGQNATGKVQIRKAFEAIAAYFKNQLKVRQGKMLVIEGGDTALVIMETILDTVDQAGADVLVVRRATLTCSEGQLQANGFVSWTTLTAQHCLMGKSREKSRGRRNLPAS